MKIGIVSVLITLSVTPPSLASQEDPNCEGRLETQMERSLKKTGDELRATLHIDITLPNGESYLVNSMESMLFVLEHVFENEKQVLGLLETIWNSPSLFEKFKKKEVDSEEQGIFLTSLQWRNSFIRIHLIRGKYDGRLQVTIYPVNFVWDEDTVGFQRQENPYFVKDYDPI